MSQKAQKKFLLILRIFQDIVLIQNELDTLGHRVAARQVAGLADNPTDVYRRLVEARR